MTPAERSTLHRARRARGEIVLTVALAPHVMRALVRLGLFPEDGDKADLANAVELFLATAPSVVGIGEALYPERS